VANSAEISFCDSAAEANLQLLVDALDVINFDGGPAPSALREHNEGMNGWRFAPVEHLKCFILHYGSMLCSFSHLF